MANNIDAEQLILVIDKLTGYCYPSENTTINKERLENLELKLELVDYLIDEIMAASKLYKRPEASIASIARRARNYLKDIRMWLDDIEHLRSED